MIDEIETDVPWWQPVVFAAMAGGMAWGVRGQYGHETGAMMAGLLVSLVLVCLFCRNAPSLWAARVVALCTVAMGFGGTMTYGQTLGLTHNPDMIGNWAGLGWGLLGCAVKGGVWIGFAGVFLGMGLGGVRYRARDLLVMMFMLIGLFYLGTRILNSPYYPARQLLPPIYFSDSWDWVADKVNVKPRRESWGGLWVALLGTIGYVTWYYRDRMALRLAGWGILGGAIGFPLGQSIQAWAHWNSEAVNAFLTFSTEVVRDGEMVESTFLLPINWWNMMETTYGATMGGVLGLGVWLSRRHIKTYPDAGKRELPIPWEWMLLALHVALLVNAEFLDLDDPSLENLERLYGFGLVLGIIPIVAIVGGRRWPYFMALPILLVPIAGKTVRQLVYSVAENQPELATDPILGWIAYLVVPLLIATVAAVVFARQGRAGKSAHAFARWGLLLGAWLIFYLNTAFFHWPRHWFSLERWTSRYANQLIFTVLIIGITCMVLFLCKPEPRNAAPPQGA